MNPLSRIAATLAAFLCLTTASLAEPYVNYLCRDGQKLSVIYEKSGTALVMVGGGGLRLSRRGPGSRYALPGGELRIGGREAVFSMAGRASTRCRLVERGAR
jgi:hypothetical protein